MITSKKMEWICLVVLCALGLELADGYPFGAPSKACRSMTPLHRSIQPRTGPPPYAIRAGAASYQPNGTLTVTLYSKCDSGGFGGFLLEARRVDIGADRHVPVGFFTVIDRSAAVSGCGLPITEFKAQAVTHEDGSDLKSRIVFEWSAPTQSVGDIAMVATFVKNYNTIWVKVHSDIVEDITSNIRANVGIEIYPTVTSCDPTTATTTTSTTTTTPTMTTTTPTTTTTTTPPMTTTTTPPMMTTATTPTTTTTELRPSLAFPSPITIAPPEAATLPATTVSTSTVESTAGPRTATIPKGTNKLSTANDTMTQTTHAALAQTASPSPSTHSSVNRTTNSTREELPCPPSPAPAPPVVTGASHNATAGKTGAIIDVECGKSKGCYSLCDGDVCHFSVSWKNLTAEAQIEFEITSMLQSKANQWVALGFSRDTEMGDDSVVECLLLSSGVIGVYTSYNDQNNNERIGTVGVSEVQGSFENGTLGCTFRRRASVEGNNKIFDLGNGSNWHLLVASGSTLGNEKKPHSFIELPIASQRRMSMETTESEISQMAGHGRTHGNHGLGSMLIRAHGSLMLVAWVFTASLGMIVARYYRRLGGKGTCATEKCWFQIHRLCMVLTIICVVIGFTLIFVHVEGYSAVGTLPGQAGYLRAHPILGIIVTGLVVMNFLMALMRPAPGGKARPIYNWFHWAVGTSAWILAVVTIFFGFGIEHAGVHRFTKYVMAAFVGYQLLAEIVLEMISCMTTTRRSTKYEMMQMAEKKGHIIVSDTDPDSDGNEHKGVGFTKLVILLLHVLILTTFLIVLLIFVNLSF